MSAIERYDDVFGRLTLDERFKTWNGQLALGERVLRLDVNVTENDEINAAMKQAFQTCQAKGFDFKGAAADRLLDAYNQRWNPDEPIDAAAFMDKLTLEQITFEQDGTVTLWYDDGELFGGHALFVEIFSDGTIGRVEIAG